MSQILYNRATFLEKQLGMTTRQMHLCMRALSSLMGYCLTLSNPKKKIDTLPVKLVFQMTLVLEHLAFGEELLVNGVHLSRDPFPPQAQEMSLRIINDFNIPVNVAESLVVIIGYYMAITSVSIDRDPIDIAIPFYENLFNSRDVKGMWDVRIN